MCFSASASFGAAAIIGASGVICLKKVTRPSLVMFASIPLLFAVQQACEGFLWLSLRAGHVPGGQRAFVMFFLFFAQVLWTTWIPFSFLLIETEKQRKKWIGLILAAGILCSVILAYRLLTADVSFGISRSHIVYHLPAMQPVAAVTSILYVVATILPGFVSSVRGTTRLSAMLLVTLLVSWWYFDNSLISIWCYFAALISIFILWMLWADAKHITVVRRTHSPG